MQCYFCRCISQVQLDGNFPRTLFFAPRRGDLLENVSYVKTKMFEEAWLFDNLLLTYFWVSNRELSGFLLPCWCWGAEGLMVHMQSLCGLLRGLGPRPFWGVWYGVLMGSSEPLSFCGRWLTLVSLAESLRGPCSRFCPSPLCRVHQRLSRTSCEVSQSKKTCRKSSRTGSNQLFCFSQKK